MDNVFDVLQERGYIAQTTHEDEIRELLGSGPVTFYIGFDPTADSLHIGHFLQLMVMSHMQRAGHRPIALLGGGTAMVGDPTGKTDMRKMMTREVIQKNADAFKKQMERFLDFSKSPYTGSEGDNGSPYPASNGGNGSPYPGTDGNNRSPYPGAIGDNGSPYPGANGDNGSPYPGIDRNTDNHDSSLENRVKNYSTIKNYIDKCSNNINNKAIMVNNADWLLNLNYVDFLREIGVHFSVNRMLTAECFKTRLERGLSFLEFNYMLMQSYDFLELYRRYGCRLQLGGDDQWANIINGADLIRRVEGESAYGMTFNLLTTGEGKKMGKTEQGAVWLDPEKTSPYDFYQNWRNVGDTEVAQRLAFYTFLPMDEVRRLSALEGQEINEAKEILAYEVTKLVHGEEEAKKAREAARALFGSGGEAEVPGTALTASEYAEEANIVDMLAHVGLASSKGEARRLVQQGGIYVNDERVTDIGHTLSEKDIQDGSVLIRKGKKKYFRITVEG